MTRKMHLWSFLFVTLCLAVAACSAAKPAEVVSSGFTPSAACIVPDVVGLGSAAAEELLVGLGLQPVRSTQFDTDAVAGTVISQKPQADTRLGPCEGDVEIVVTMGEPPEPPSTPVPSTISPAPTQASEPPTSTPSESCNEWNLASDFRVWPNQENPNRDSCGNQEIWHFLSSSSLERMPNSYFLLSGFVPDHEGKVGFLSWRNSAAEEGSLYFNATGDALDLAGVPWPKNTVAVHPGPDRLAIVGWRSPMDGHITIRGSILDLNPGCGDGVNWYVDKGSSSLAGGSIDNAGRREFQSGLGGNNLTNLAVSRGEFVYLIIHPRGDYSCDTTLVNLAISP